MDPITAASIALKGLRMIFELHETIKRQRRVNKQTYLRLTEMFVELQQSEQPLQSNETLRRSDAIMKFAAAVDKFLAYLQKYNSMHRIGRIFKYSEMEEERLEIVDEIDQLFRMLNLATSVTVMNLEDSETKNAARFFAKLEGIHGDIKLTHDQVQAALRALAEKRSKEAVKQKTLSVHLPARKETSPNSMARGRVLVRQAPIQKKYAARDQVGEDLLNQKPAVKTSTPPNTIKKNPLIERKGIPASAETDRNSPIVEEPASKQNTNRGKLVEEKPPIELELSPACTATEEEEFVNQQSDAEQNTAELVEDKKLIELKWSPASSETAGMALTIQKTAPEQKTIDDFVEEKEPIGLEQSNASVVLAKKVLVAQKSELIQRAVDSLDDTVVLNWKGILDQIITNFAADETKRTDQRLLPKQRISLLDNVSVPLIIQKLGSGHATPLQKEKSFLLLISKCITSSNRVQVYKTGGIQVLEREVKEGESFFAQLYALHCLSWFTFSYSKMRESEFMRLRGCVREATHAEILSTLHELQHIDENVKEAAAIRCSCMATRGDGDRLRNAGVLRLLVGLLTNGTASQKLWAAETLETLASNNDESCVAIAHEGGIPPLVALLRSGSDMQKQEAAYALGSMAANDSETRAKIAREGAIPPMVAFVKAVTDAQNQWAVYALGMLSSDNEANRVLIAEEGAIPPLVALLRMGTHAQKQWAAYTLGNLAYNNDANRVNITVEGAIIPLIKLLQVGTDAQKQWAAYGLGNLACDNDAALNLDEAIVPLVELVRAGSDPQKQSAAYTLGTLAANNDASRVEIGRNGAIAPLVQLLQAGTDEQKEWAAYAVGCIAKNNEENRAAIVDEGAGKPLAALVETGTEEQKSKAARTLELLACNDKLRGKLIPSDQMSSTWMEYLRAGVNSQTANATAALSTLETVRDGMIPLLHRFVSPDTDAQMQLKFIKAELISPNVPSEAQEGNHLHNIADAW